MFETKIKLNSIGQVQKFVTFVTTLPCNVDLTTEGNRYVVDAKSIMGVFSLDLSKPVTVIMHTSDEDIILKLKKFVANMED